jgi:cytochrome c oxidase cbb3-type subunit 2
VARARSRLAALGALVATLLLVPAARAQAPGGRQVYERYCAVCHGVAGDGNGRAAPRLAVKPADFTTGRYKFRSTPSGAVPTDADLLRTLLRGVRRTPMVPQTHITPAELQAVVQYLKTFSRRFADPPPLPVPVPPASAVTPEVVERGARLYREAACPDCHGDGGKGDGPSARPGMRDARNLPIFPTDLTRRPLKRGSEPEETWKSIALGLDGTPMPSYAEALRPDEIWAVVAFLESLVSPERRFAEDRIIPGQEALGDQIEREEQGR